MSLEFTFTTIFAFCEFGERVTHQFNLFNEKFCHCDWYLLPIEIQRMYLIVLVGVQDPVMIRGFANTLCSRDAFKKVISFSFWCL